MRDNTVLDDEVINILRAAHWSSASLKFDGDQLVVADEKMFFTKYDMNLHIVEKLCENLIRKPGCPEFFIYFNGKLIGEGKIMHKQKLVKWFTIKPGVATE